MYNLNVSGPGVGTGGSGLLSLPLPQGENSTTPRTPEIVNSLIAMSNPFDSSYRARAPRLASSPPGGSDTSTSSSGSPGCVSPPSIQHTCSQLIKEGLKLSIQSKRRQNQRSGHVGEDPKMPRRDEVSCDGLGDDDDDDPFSPGDGLTPEDEERRRRRRERNKIAATKCRLKKRERTVNLVQESEILENQNHDLKSQIQELETQRRRLVDMLSVHRPSCTKAQAFSSGDNTTFSTTNFQTFPRPSMSMESSTNMFRRMNMNSFPRTSTSVVDATMTYRRVEMSSATCIDPYQRMETVLEEAAFCRPPVESTVYHNFESQEVKDTSLLVPYCRSSVNSVESAPSFTRIGEQYSCQNLTNLDQFVKPELPSMGGFQSPASSFGQPSSLDMNNSVSPQYESSVNSPSLSSTTYQHFDEESDTFSGGFSPAGLDRSCIA